MSAAELVGPVFLVGCPRSGTTLLQQMLDAHPALAIAPETFFVRRFLKTRDTFEHDWQSGGRDRLLSAWRRAPEFAEMALDDAAIAASVEPASDVVDAFARLLSRFAQASGARMVGEKTPNHLLYMRSLEQAFPGARFIHILRDPRAVVDSWRHVPWSNGTPAADAEVWRKYMQAAREKPPRDRRRLLTVRYEALVLDPAAQLRRVCDFLGLPFDDAMLRHHTRSHTTVNALREPWKAAALAPISTASIDAWSEQVDGTTLCAIEAVTWFEMRRLAYEPLTPAWRVWPRALHRAAARRLRARCRERRA